MEIIDIAKKIESVGGKLYLVGGAVRDKLLQLPVEDEDYCVTNITSSTFQDLFPSAVLQGKAFPVFRLENKEFAMARKEAKIGIGHQNFAIETAPNITIEEDLVRRDLTINSIAQEVLSGEIVDPFNGIKDLENKILRATSPAFIEDPLRAYRTARFATTLEFEVEPSTLAFCSSVKDELSSLAPERVFYEFQKALSTKKPSTFFRILEKVNILDVHFGELENLIGSLQPIQYHPEGDSFEHTIQVVDNCAKKTDDLSVRFSALVHDLGKGVTQKREYPHHHGHDKNGVPLVSDLGNRIGVPKSWIRCGKTACAEHMLGGIFGRMSPAKKVSFMERVSSSPLGLKNLQIVVDSDRSGRGSYIPSPKEEIESHFYSFCKECLSTVTGDVIKQKYPTLEGKAFGERLHAERVKWVTQNYCENMPSKI